MKKGLLRWYGMKKGVNEMVWDEEELLDGMG
jgi:hypothetical protein